MLGIATSSAHIARARPFAALSALAAFATTIFLAACGGGGSGGGGSSAPQVTGVLSAPGGTIAFNAPTGFRRLLAELFGGDAVAALPGTTAVAGATVRLIEVDNTGAQVGPDIGSALTAGDGSFSIAVPTTFVPAPRFVLRATGGATLDRLVSDFGSQDVDPASQATKALVLQQLSGGSLQSLSPLQVGELGNGIADAANAISSQSSATLLVAALTAVAQNDVELSSAVSNLTASFGIAGTVTDGQGTPLPNIKIVVKDFGLMIKRAETRTDANGQYTLALNSGDYIVGAMNFTTSSAGSEWWTCNDAPGPCGASNQFSAGKVTVGAGTVTVNFKLEPGARVQGSITASGSATPLGGVQLGVRDFDSNQVVAFADSKADGTFLVNLRPGNYFLSARNQTVLPFASAPYNGPGSGGTTLGGGGVNVGDASPVVLKAGDVVTANFQLVEGGLVKGIVTDGAGSPSPVTGLSVRFYQTTVDDPSGAFVEAVPTNLAGEYRMWVRPGTYNVRARGQTGTPNVVTFSNNNNPPDVNFTAAMGRATAVVNGPGPVPLSQVKVQVFDTSNTFLGHEITNSDGSVEIYAATGASYRIQYLLDNGSTAVGSVVDTGTSTPTQTVLASATAVAFGAGSVTTPILLGGGTGTITLPAGGELKGIVRLGTAPIGNVIVQVRSGGSRTVNTRTSQDGSYSVSMPGATYGRVCAFIVGTVSPCPNPATPSSPNQFGATDNVLVTNGQSVSANVTIPIQ
jgi:hypothetical protein